MRSEKDYNRHGDSKHMPLTKMKKVHGCRCGKQHGICGVPWGARHHAKLEAKRYISRSIKDGLQDLVLYDYGNCGSALPLI